MSKFDNWEDLMPAKPMKKSGGFGLSAMRVSLLFGAAAIAMALFLTPYADGSKDSVVARHFTNPGIDYTTTASTKRNPQAFTIRRSVLQANPNDSCYIKADGTYSGAC